MAVVVDVLAGAPGAVGQRAQAPAETPLGVADGLLHGSLDRLRPEAPDELNQPLLAHVVGRDLALDVEAHQRIPHRVHDPVEKVLAELSLFHQLDRGHPEALLVDVHHPDGEPARVLPPYVRLVPRGARPAEDLALVEERGHRGDVGLVDGAHPGVAADEHVLLADPRILPAPLHDMGDGEGKDVGLDDDVGPHHHHGAVRQRDPRVGVVGLDKRLRTRTIHVADAHLLGDLVQLVQDNLEGYGVQALPAHRLRPPPRWSVTFWYGSTSARWRGPTTTVVEAYSMMAGPGTRLPDSSRSPS